MHEYLEFSSLEVLASAVRHILIYLRRKARCGESWPKRCAVAQVVADPPAFESALAINKTHQAHTRHTAIEKPTREILLLPRSPCQSTLNLTKYTSK